MHFVGRTSARHLGIHAVIRLSPVLHIIGECAPRPLPRSTIEIETPSGPIVAEVLSSRDDRMVIEAQDRLWGVTPIRPNEVLGASGFFEDSGAVDWIIRCAG